MRYADVAVVKYAVLFRNMNRHPGDPFRFITNAFKISNGLDHSHYHSEAR